MKFLIILFALVLGGCNIPVQVEGGVEPVELESQAIPVFIATVDGIIRYVNDDRFDCISGFFYEIGTPGVAYSGTDGVDDTCINPDTPITVTRTRDSLYPLLE